MRLTEAHLTAGGEAVALHWDSGAAARFHAIWLRDNALDPATRSPGNGQRLISILDVPTDTRITEVQILPSDDLRLHLVPERKDVTFPGKWLVDHRYDGTPHRAPGWTASDIVLWDRGLDVNAFASEYDAVAKDARALRRWLGFVRSHGFALLRGVPAESGALCAVAELFGYVRETNYGRWFEVRAEVDPNNLAYTNLGLQAHTDNPYRDPVPGLQLLACLRNAVDGGESIVVDGFRAALLLKAKIRAPSTCCRATARASPTPAARACGSPPRSR